MPKLSVWFVRLALLHLLTGFSLGALLLYHKGVPIHPALWNVLPAHIEMLLLGWMAQLILGVAFWILPRFSQGPRRGDERPAWAAFWLLNLGVLSVALAPFLPPASAWAPFAGRILEVLAAAAFALHAWPRVKAAAK